MSSTLKLETKRRFLRLQGRQLYRRVPMKRIRIQNDCDANGELGKSN
jgi:hypothetical protein